MIPQFVLDNCANSIETESGTVYFFETKDSDGWVIYWPQDNETFHTYRYPPDWMT